MYIHIGNIAVPKPDVQQIFCKDANNHNPFALNRLQQPPTNFMIRVQNCMNERCQDFAFSVICEESVLPQADRPLPTNENMYIELWTVYVVTFFIISVRSPCASSSGVGGSGRFGGPGGNCGGVDGAESSDSTLNPGLYEIGLMHETKRNQKTEGGQEGR